MDPDVVLELRARLEGRNEFRKIEKRRNDRQARLNQARQRMLNGQDTG